MNSDAKGLTPELEHLSFAGDAAWGGKTAHLAVSADNAMARDDKRNGISGHYASDGPARGGSARPFRQFGISYCLAGLYFSAGHQNLLGKYQMGRGLILA